MELDTRRKIYEQIKKSPGIHFRELERRVQLIGGSLQYHLHDLEKKNLIVSLSDEDYVRYFIKDKSLSDNEKEIISFLRRSGCRHILIQLLTNTGMNNNELSLAVDLSPSTVSWNLNKLVKAGIVERKKIGRISKFAVVDPSVVSALLICYKESFLDNLLDGFIEMWEIRNPK